MASSKGLRKPKKLHVKQTVKKAGNARSAPQDGESVEPDLLVHALPSLPSPVRVVEVANQELFAKQLLPRLPSLFRKTEGRAFGPEALQAWIQVEKGLEKFLLPSLPEAEELLNELAQCVSPSPSSSSLPASRRTWERSAFYWKDEDGPSKIGNVRGSSSKVHGKETWSSWHEYGFLFQICKESTESAPSSNFVVTRTHAYKTLGSIMTKTTMKVRAEGRQAVFRNVVTFDPWSSNMGRVDPQWTLIYLHSFSNKGTGYKELPHYFGVSDAAVRVVCPTAPLLEQECFCDWKVWKGKKLKWRRIKFNAWFDYITDRGGSAENKIDVQSLLSMRARIHGLIRDEIKRVGGDPKRVIIGGTSQGCCVALDAALTYPEELGGVIGLVGHALSATPLDLGKERASMPIHLFQETSDGEMKWKWVKGIVERVAAAGFNVISKREADPAGSGHWIQAIEGKWICSALQEIVSGASREL